MVQYKLTFIHLVKKLFVFYGATGRFIAVILFLSFRRVLNVICSFWVIPRRLSSNCRCFGTHCRFHLHGQVNSPAYEDADVSELTVGFIFMGRWIHLPMKMKPTVSSETSAIRTQTPGNCPKRNKLHLQNDTLIPVLSQTNRVITVQPCSFKSNINRVRKIAKDLTASSFLSLRPPARNNAAPTGRILMKFDIWVPFENEIQVSLKSDKNNGFFTRIPLNTSHSILLRMR